MQEKLVYEYAIVRIVPQPERGEFLNVGIVLYCKRKSFLAMQFELDAKRIQTAFPMLNLEEIEAHLVSFEQICEQNNNTRPIANMDMASRFRWLTAKRSTVIQTSEVHPGFCSNPQDTLQKLHKELVEL